MRYNIITNKTIGEHMIDRVRQIVEDKAGGNYSSFSTAIGMKQNTLSQQLNKKRGLSLDVIVKIASTYPDISLDWIITGKGTMLKAEKEPMAVQSMDNNCLLDRYEKVIRENERLRMEIEQLKNNASKKADTNSYTSKTRSTGEVQEE